MWHVWGEEKRIQGFGGLRERDDLKGLGVYGRIILKWIFKKWGGGMDWIDRDRWLALVNVVVNHRVL
jgi:hypothetical protein